MPLKSTNNPTDIVTATGGKQHARRSGLPEIRDRQRAPRTGDPGIGHLARRRSRQMGLVSRGATLQNAECRRRSRQLWSDGQRNGQQSLIRNRVPAGRPGGSCAVRNLSGCPDSVILLRWQDQQLRTSCESATGKQINPAEIAPRPDVRLMPLKSRHGGNLGVPVGAKGGVVRRLTHASSGEGWVLFA